MAVQSSGPGWRYPDKTCKIAPIVILLLRANAACEKSLISNSFKSQSINVVICYQEPNDGECGCPNYQWLRNFDASRIPG